MLSCIDVGLKDSTKEELEKLRQTADQLGGKVQEVAEGLEKEVRNICDVTDRKITEAQQSVAAACEGIVEAEQKRRCQDFNRRQAALIDQIREECKPR